MTIYIRALCERSEKTGAGANGMGTGPIRFVASTEGVKRDGKELKVSQWRLENYRLNPVMLWAHDYLGKNLPIGKCEVFIRGRQLIADATFDQADEFARAVEAKYRSGYLSAVSVGWDDYAECPSCKNHINGMLSYYAGKVRVECPKCGKELPKDLEVWNELLDISGVPVPGDPQALIDNRIANLRSFIKDKVSQSKTARLNESSLREVLRTLDLIWLDLALNNLETKNQIQKLIYRSLDSEDPNLN